MLKQFIKDENGQGMVEYGLIIALIAIVVITALGLLGGKINEVFEKANNKLDEAMDETPAGE